MGEMQARVLQMTKELNSLMQHLCAEQCDSVEEVLSVEIMENFKASIDGMRKLVWQYIERASKDLGREQEQGLQRAAQMLSHLATGAPTLFHSAHTADPRSFIEKVEQIVEKHLPGLGSGLKPEPIWRSTKSNNQEHSAPQKAWRVLLVEDDEPLRAIVTEMLTRRGICVSATPSASSGLIAYRTALDPFDLLVAEVMPSMEGWRLAENIRMINAHLPVLLMSGYSPEEMNEQARIRDYPLLLKPFTGPQLIDKIQAVILTRLLDPK